MSSNLSSIINSEASDVQYGILADIAPVDVGTIVQGRDPETPAMVDEHLLRADSTPIIDITDSFPIEEPMEEPNIIMGIDCCNGDNDSESSKDELPTEPSAALGMDVSSNLENQDQNGKDEGVVSVFRAGFREILDDLEDKLHTQESYGEFDVAMEAAISKTTRIAQATIPSLGVVSETGSSSLSEVEGDWVDTHMETEISIMDGSPPANEVVNENDAISDSDDGKGHDNINDENEQVDSIQGQRMDGDVSKSFGHFRDWN